MLSSFFTISVMACWLTMGIASIKEWWQRHNEQKLSFQIVCWTIFIFSLIFSGVGVIVLIQ